MADRQAQIEYVRKWRKENADRVKTYQRTRLAWMREGNVTSDQLRRLYGRSKGRCVYCGARVTCRFSPSDPRGFDHKKPRATGGRHTVRNMVVCCLQCNIKKHKNEVWQ